MCNRVHIEVLMWLLSLLVSPLFADDPPAFAPDPAIDALFRGAIPAVERCRDEIRHVAFVCDKVARASS